MSNDSKFGGLVGVLGVTMAVCCGLPVLLGASIAVGAAGLALGSGLVVVAGALLGVWDGAATVPHGAANFLTRGPTIDAQPSLARSDEDPGPADALDPDDRREFRARPHTKG